MPDRVGEPTRSDGWLADAARHRPVRGAGHLFAVAARAASVRDARVDGRRQPDGVLQRRDGPLRLRRRLLGYLSVLFVAAATRPTATVARPARHGRVRHRRSGREWSTSASSTGLATTPSSACSSRWRSGSARCSFQVLAASQHVQPGDVLLRQPRLSSPRTTSSSSAPGRCVTRAVRVAVQPARVRQLQPEPRPHRAD